MKFKKSMLTVFTVLTLGAGAAQAQNLVTNGSFEADSQTAGSWKIYNNLTGWTGATPGIELRNNVAGAAQNGVNYIELDTTQNSSMYQDIMAGGQVELSFWYSARGDTASMKLDTNKLSYSFGNLSGDLLSEGTSSTGTNQWQHYTGVVNLGGYGAHRLTFAAAGKSDSYGGSLDNVSVSAVPEPETYALMLAGLGLVGAIARRRKQQNA